MSELSFKMISDPDPKGPKQVCDGQTQRFPLQTTRAQAAILQLLNKNNTALVIKKTVK